jgi:hypothetical protein
MQTGQLMIPKYQRLAIDILRNKESHAKFAKVFELDFAFLASWREPKLVPDKV